ncbi:MAG: molybdopterin-guanine dinucleotide biosynthesis protein B [Deltaproteobacteria bacterium]
MIPVVGFVGYSNSGKTTIVSKLVSILKSRGYRVAAVKHASHGYDMDMPGKDSWQHFEAGADQVVVVGPESFSHHYRGTAKLLDVINVISEVDIILVEGFKTEPIPKIEIISQDNPGQRIALGEYLQAVISTQDPRETVPCFDPDDLYPLANFLAERFINKGKK